MTPRFHWWMYIAASLTWLMTASFYFVSLSASKSLPFPDGKGLLPNAVNTEICEDWSWQSGNYTYGCTPEEKREEIIGLLRWQLAWSILAPLVFNSDSWRLDPVGAIVFVIFITPYIAAALYAGLYYCIANGIWWVTEKKKVV